MTSPDGKSRDWKPNRGQAIDQLYAWIATEPDGGEGVLGHDVPGLGFMPLVGADKARMESYRTHAADIQQRSGYRVCLKVFGTGVVIDEIKPRNVSNPKEPK